LINCENGESQESQTGFVEISKIRNPISRLKKAKKSFEALEIKV
jgi:hypothetical protein